MQLPFTVEQFFLVFSRYNTAVAPVQPILYCLGLLAAWLAYRPVHSDRVIAALLALLWTWMGAVYHIGFFRSINPVALVFGIAFIIQAAIFLGLGVVGNRLRFHPPPDWRAGAGAALLSYGFILYPILARHLGHRYPAAPTFGLPCPTTIVTLGLLLWQPGRMTVLPTMVPLLWSAIGASAAFQLGVPEDLGLGAAGLITLVALVLGRRRPAA